MCLYWESVVGWTLSQQNKSRLPNIESLIYCNCFPILRPSVKIDPGVEPLFPVTTFHYYVTGVHILGLTEENKYRVIIENDTLTDSICFWLVTLFDLIKLRTDCNKMM